MNARAKIACLAVLLLLAPALSGAANRLPAPDKLTLKNGITVYYYKSIDLPLVSFRLWIRGAGTANEPADLEGVANLTANQMMKGTAKMDADAIAEAVDFLGARLSIGASDEYASVNGESLKEHFPRLGIYQDLAHGFS